MQIPDRLVKKYEVKPRENIDMPPRRVSTAIFMGIVFLVASNSSTLAGVTNTVENVE